MAKGVWAWLGLPDRLYLDRHSRGNRRAGVTLSAIGLREPKVRMSPDAKKVRGTGCTTSPTVCIAAALGVAGFAEDLGSSVLFRGVQAWTSSAGAALFGVGFAGIDIGSGAAVIGELIAGEVGRSVVRC